jgi:hypothetical protein
MQELFFDRQYGRLNSAPEKSEAIFDNGGFLIFLDSEQDVSLGRWRF